MNDEDIVISIDLLTLDLTFNHFIVNDIYYFKSIRIWQKIWRLSRGEAFLDLSRLQFLLLTDLKATGFLV